MSAPQPRIGILLSTFNGETYLPAQLDSLLAQDHANLVIVVRDDGSSDGTRDILQRYATANPGRMVIIPNEIGNRGACGSFGRLLDYALEQREVLGLTPAYLAFSDQDDVWDADKLSVSLRAMQQQEERTAGPVLVHTDLRVVDANLEQLAPSLVSYQGLSPTRLNFGRVLVANAVTGCTLMCNESLARRAVPVPVGAVMHDWWIAIMAGLHGSTVYVDRATVSYRQHGGNTLGARRRMPKTSVDARIRRALDDDDTGIFERLALQCQTLLLTHGAAMNARQVRICRLGCALGRGPALWRKLLYRVVRSL
ncbi:MAG: putative glycosyltransferase EpsE [Pseudomonadota bacterium]|jgi:glycosyltransferase involved in cell wall biosynthesis